MWKKFYRWLDERTGIESLIRKTKDEPIRGGARWSYVFGSAIVLLLAIQILTGIVLTMYYVPSSDHAHASVAFIQKVVAGGALLRGLHYYGAGALLILAAIHFGQTYLFAAYKKKRELLWLTGLVMLGLLLAFAFTGYLLPWTQEAYFGTKVGTSIMSEIPGVGRWMQRVVLGGSEMTTLTLSRFFMVHIWVLPLGLLLFVFVHVGLFRKAGAAGPFHHRDDPRVETFYPRQVFMDALFFFVVFLILVYLAVMHPAVLGPEADPTSGYLARPPWYFLPLFQLLKYFSGNLTLLPAVVLPGVALLALVLLPFLDRKEERHPAYRPVAVLMFLVGLLGAGGLIALARYQDYANPGVRAKIMKQQAEELAYMKAPFQPQEIGRTIPVQAPTVIAMGNVRNPVLRIYFANCANCHGADATGGPMGPSLIRLASDRHLSRDFLVRYIAGHFRERSADLMPQFQQLSVRQCTELADWLLRLDSPHRLETVAAQAQPQPHPKPRAKKLETARPSAQAPAPVGPPEAFLKNCALCHASDAGGNIGPSLIGIVGTPNRSPDDLMKLLDDPRSYGLKDPMPASFPMLTVADKKAIIDWLATLK